MISSVTAHNLSPTAFLVDKKIYFFRIANELKCFKDVRKSLFSSLNWAFGHCPFRKSGPTCSNQGEWGNLSNYSGEYVDLQKIRRLIFILKFLPHEISFEKQSALMSCSHTTYSSSTNIASVQTFLVM